MSQDEPIAVVSSDKTKGMYRGMKNVSLDAGGSNEDMSLARSSARLRDRHAYEKAIKEKRSTEEDELKRHIGVGKYDWVNADISVRRFPMQLEEDANVDAMSLVRFSKGVITSELAMQRMKQSGLRPVTLRGLLAFGEKNPEDQRKYPILALGSRSMFAEGYFKVPYLDMKNGLRELGLDWDFARREWHNEYRFLAIGE
jgi:hypothetical protein